LFLDAIILLFSEQIPAANHRERICPNLLLYPGTYPLAQVKLMNGDLSELPRVSSLILEEGQQFADAFVCLVAVSLEVLQHS
jgi:hypothetical protein